MIRHHVPRWLKATVAKYLKENANGWTLHIEGVTERQNGTTDKYIELRTDGPFFSQRGTKGDYFAEYEINLLVGWQFNPKNVYELETMCGHLASILGQDICILKIGPETVDDETYFETLKFSSEEGVSINNLGPIDHNVPKYEVTIEAHYNFHFVDRE